MALSALLLDGPLRLAARIGIVSASASAPGPQQQQQQHLSTVLAVVDDSFAVEPDDYLQCQSRAANSSLARFLSARQATAWHGYSTGVPAADAPTLPAAVRRRPFITAADVVGAEADDSIGSCDCGNNNNNSSNNNTHTHNNGNNTTRYRYHTTRNFIEEEDSVSDDNSDDNHNNYYYNNNNNTNMRSQPTPTLTTTTTTTASTSHDNAHTPCDASLSSSCYHSLLGWSPIQSPNPAAAAAAASSSSSSSSFSPSVGTGAALSRAAGGTVLRACTSPLLPPPPPPSPAPTQLPPPPPPPCLHALHLHQQIDVWTTAPPSPTTACRRREALRLHEELRDAMADDLASHSHSHSHSHRYDKITTGSSGGYDSVEDSAHDALDPYRELRGGRRPLMQSAYSMREVSLEDSFVLVTASMVATASDEEGGGGQEGDEDDEDDGGWFGK